MVKGLNQGSCYNCGGEGHLARYCPSKGKGKHTRSKSYSSWYATFWSNYNELSTINYSQLLLASDKGRPITFALWPSKHVAHHVMVAHDNWKRCIHSTMLQGFFAQATDKTFMISYILENRAYENYPTRPWENTRSTTYDELLNLQTC